MPSRTFAGSLGLAGDWALHESGWKVGMDDNLLQLSVAVQGRVLSQVAVEPGAPVEGDVHLLGPAHMTHPNAVAAYDEGAWHYYAPLEGWRFYNVALGSFVLFDGALWIVDDPLAAVIAALGGGGGIPDGVVSGCAVIYTGVGLDFMLTAGTFYLNGSLYSAVAQTISLDASDPLLDRVDTLFVYGSGVFDKITGTPDADPVAPDVDSETQLFLMSVLIPAAAVDLTASITDELIYDEGVEWAPTVAGANIDAASAVDPYSGAESIEATDAIGSDSVKFITGVPIAFDNAGNLIFQIKSKAFWESGHLDLRWYQGGSRKGSRVSLRDGTFGFDSSNVANYQQIAIPKYRFGVATGTGIDELWINVSSAGGIGFFLDAITLQTPDGGTTVPITSGITQDQADVRYLQQANSLSDVASVPDARDNLSIYSQAEVDAAIAAAVAASAAPIVLTIEPVAGAAYTFATADNYKHKRFTSAAAVVATVPTNATDPIPIGTRIRGTQAAAGVVTLTPAGGVTLNSRGGLLASAGLNAIFEIEKVAVNEWDCLGDLA